MSIRLTCLASLLIASLSLFAQNTDRTVTEKCGTMRVLEMRFQRNPGMKAKFEQSQANLERALSARANRTSNTEATVFIPVVFHIVLPNPNLVTNAQIQAQLDTLNRDFFGSNGDSVKIPAYFKPLFGKSNIQFCLAQRTPDGDPSNGIERIVTTRSSFGIDNAIKHSTTGGIDAWNTAKYFNVWVSALSGGLLGYATFPDDGIPNEQGVVMEYRSLPGGPYVDFSGGKTLTHETGHYFNLFHIWGDDNGACTGSDGVADTPNQADATDGCHSGVFTDNCTSTGNGIMYQNYMDYSYDNCLVMFTTGQVSRMQTALAVSTYRTSLLTSDGCQPVVLKNYNAQLKSIDQPAQRLCDANFIPAVTIRNRGSQTLTSLQIKAQVDNGPLTTVNWNGSLASQASTSVTLSNMTTTTGVHVLTIFVTSPNGQADEETTNDTLHTNIQYFTATTSVSESFESSTFPPLGWDILNPDNSITWQRVTGIAKTGTASVKMNNYDYEDVGQSDDLRLPTIGLAATTDSAFLSFQVAAAPYSSLNTPGNIWDTLSVLVSTDCGKTYTTLYKRWGASLVTRTTATQTAFIPNSTEWRKDSVNLGAFIGSNNILVAFRNTTGYENNVYLDDINLRTVSINPNLRAQGFLVTPNPTQGQVAVQFYPQPTKLQTIQVLNAIGQKVAEIRIASGQGGTLYNVDLSRYAAGMYTVRAIFSDKVLEKKIIKIQ